MYQNITALELDDSQSPCCLSFVLTGWYVLLPDSKQNSQR
jgi:hypothetical protein